MPTQADIDQQLERLAIERSNLANYLRQQAIHGSAYVPPMIVSGIRESRASIQQIKQVLQAWNVRVEDHPDDGTSSTGVPLQAEPVPVSVDPIRLRQILNEHFSDEELRDLCFDLQIDHDSLPGSGKAAKARELIQYTQRRGSYSQLVAKVKRLRPNADFSAPPADNA